MADDDAGFPPSTGMPASTPGKPPGITEVSTLRRFEAREAVVSKVSERLDDAAPADNEREAVVTADEATEAASSSADGHAGGGSSAAGTATSPASKEAERTGVVWAAAGNAKTGGAKEKT